MNFNFIFNRARNLITNPQIEWVRIESEPTSKKKLLRSYVIPFVILIAVCSFIGASVFSLQYYSFSIIITKIVITAALVIGMVYLSSIIINELTISFGMARNLEGTFKLISYSFTSFFISSCLVGLLPDMQILSILGVHSIYLFWLGSSSILKIPETNKVGFVVVSFLIIIGIYAILSLIVGTIVAGMQYVSQPILQ